MYRSDVFSLSVAVLSLKKQFFRFAYLLVVVWALDGLTARAQPVCSGNCIIDPDAVQVGGAPGGLGQLNVVGTGSQLDLTGLVLNFDVGVDSADPVTGGGQVQILNGGQIQFDASSAVFMRLGSSQFGGPGTGNGSLLVDGAGSFLLLDGVDRADLDVHGVATGGPIELTPTRLEIINGGDVFLTAVNPGPDAGGFAALDIGLEQGSEGFGLVSTGGTLRIESDQFARLDVGQFGGRGELRVLDGGSVLVGSVTTPTPTAIMQIGGAPFGGLGAVNDGFGRLLIEGAGSSVVINGSDTARVFAAGGFVAQIAGDEQSGPADGAISIADGARMEIVAPDLTLGIAAVEGAVASTGSISVDGSGSTLIVGDASSTQVNFNIGTVLADPNFGTPVSADGVLNVTNGAVVDVNGVNQPFINVGMHFDDNTSPVIEAGTAVGTVNVDTGAEFRTNGIMVVGNQNGTGNFNISNGGTVTFDGSSNTDVNVGRADIGVGNLGGTGVMSITSGGSLIIRETDPGEIGDITVGEGVFAGSPSSGLVEVIGSGSSVVIDAPTAILQVAGSFAFSPDDQSTGEFAVLDGATTTLNGIDSFVQVGSSGGAGLLRISGSGSLMTVTGSASADVSIAGGGTVDVSNLGVLDITSAPGLGNLFVGRTQDAPDAPSAFLRGDGLIRVSNVVEVVDGGVISPGNGPNALGTLTIDGDLIVQPGGILEIDALEDGTSDSLSITGTATLNGGIVSALTPDSDFSVARDYTILAATGGVSGVFDDVTSNLAYLLPSLSYTDNSVVLTLERLGGEIQQDVLEETTSQELSINTRTTTTVVSNQVANVLSYSLGFGIGTGTGSSSSSTSTAYVPGSFSTGLSAGDDDQSGNVWVNYTPSFYKTDTVLPGSDRQQTVDGRGYSLMVGTDRAFSERLVAGAIFGAEGTDLNFGTINGSQDNDGLMVGAYAGFLLNDYAYAGINGNYTWLDNEIEEAAFGSTSLVRGEFSSERYQLAADLNFVKVIDNYDLRWQAGVSFMEETADAYQTTVGDTAQPIDQRLARLRLGFTARYSGEKHRPYLSVAYENDFDSAVDLTDDTGFVTYLGIRSQGYNERLFFDAFVSAIVGREGQDHNMVGLNITYLL